MPFAWTARQFVGGSLCLDLVNTVYYADDPARRGDRLRTPQDVAGWLSAAARYGAAEELRGMGTADAQVDIEASLEILALRHCTDDLFRAAARGQVPSPLAWRGILAALYKAAPDIGLALDSGGLRLLAGPAGPRAPLAAIAASALRLAHSPLMSRLKCCPNCHWLFVDRSRNASRVWCDMLTCGNRAKARRHHMARSSAKDNHHAH